MMMQGKLVAISGGNDGIGFATAQQLLEKGADLVLFCRNMEKAKLTKEKLLVKNKSANIELIEADMNSFASIKKGCESFNSKHDKLDVLINNAGVMRTQFALSEDRIEQTMAINHFGYFLMTYYLMPAIKNAPKARIVNVSSRAHFGVELDFDTINSKTHFNFRKQYKCSKLANVLFTKKLAEILKKDQIAVNCLDPGVVKTRIGNKAGNRLFSWVWSIFTLSGISPEKGAATSVYLASDPNARNFSGEYFEECKPIESSETTHKQASIDALWNWSLGISGIKSWGYK